MEIACIFYKQGKLMCIVGEHTGSNKCIVHSAWQGWHLPLHREKGQMFQGTNAGLSFFKAFLRDPLSCLKAFSKGKN